MGWSPNVTALRQFGLAFGTAYQIYDDCVDLFGSEAAAGKSLGTDLAKGKLTLPVLLLWERATAADRAARGVPRPELAGSGSGGGWGSSFYRALRCVGLVDRGDIHACLGERSRQMTAHSAGIGQVARVCLD